MSDRRNPFQSVIDAQFQSRWDSGEALRTLLDDFFDVHVRSGLIPSATVAEIAGFSSHQDGPIAFKLQRNFGRVNRGVSSRIHPNPAYTIPFKDGMPCFCCGDVIAYQWPGERGFQINPGRPLIVLPNISPIFLPHFTLVSPAHDPQMMDLHTMIACAHLIPGGWVIQNGPDAGATNPWHYHLQVFFEPDLPIQNCPAFPLSSTVDQLDHPALILKITNPDIAIQVAADYLKLGDTRRLNILVRVIDDECHTYLILRDTRFRTALYRSGQPGYAESAGIISASSELIYAQWMAEGCQRYCELMSDIRPRDEETEVFKSTRVRSF
jgi:hypothetical protein